MEIRLVLMRNDGGGYAAYIPALIGCVCVGETIEQTLRNMRETLGRYFAPGKQSI